MDDREKDELRVLAEWVEHPGYDVFSRRTQERIDQWKEGFPFNVKDGDELLLVKGQIGVLQELLQLKDRVLEVHNNPSLFDEIPD